MKNLYEILEVDRKASNEIIKVAHKSLVKKYHPDLKDGIDKSYSEEKIKEINEAYDILSDPIKRAEYDETLVDQNISNEQINLILKENTRLKMELNYLKNGFYTNQETKNTNYSNLNYDNSRNTSEENYDNNLNNNNSSGIKSFIYNLDNGVKNIIAILLTFLIIFIFLKIPFLRDFIINLFNQGFVIVIIVILAFILYFRNKK